MGLRWLGWVLLGGSLGAVQAATTVSNPYAGMVRHSVDNATVNGRSVDYEVVVIDLTDPNINLFLTPDNGAAAGETTLQTTRSFASTYSTELAINTHFFSTVGGSGGNVTGIAASNGTVYSPFETTGHLTGLNISSTNFAETVFGAAGGTAFTGTATVPWPSIGPGSVLYQNGAVKNTGATDFRARTQIGISRNGARMILFASSSGMTEQEAAGILVYEFGAFDVHGMDGGGSTTMVLRTGASTQTIVVRESAFSERSVGASLGVQAADYVAGIPDAMSWDADPGQAGIQQGAGTWDFSLGNWQAAGVNRTWANSRTATLGAGGGALITLGGRIAVTDLGVDGGYTLGTSAGPTLALFGNVTTTGTAATVVNAPLHESTSFTKRGAQTLVLGTGSRISMLNLAEGTIDLGNQTFSLLDRLTPMTLTGGTIQNGQIVFTAAASELASPSGTTTVEADLTATRITKTGSGTVRLRGTNVWTGPLTIQEGTLEWVRPPPCRTAPWW